MGWMVFSIIVFLAGLLDAYKQKFLVHKILRYKSSKGVSRAFINAGIVHKIFLSVWAIFYLGDWVVSISSLFALYTTVELWYIVYKYYPYKNKGRFGWKRPSMLKYILNSLTPNKFCKIL